MLRSLLLTLALGALASAQTPPPARLELRDFLREIPAREAMARLPAPGFTLEQRSSVVRTEPHEGRHEWVLAEPSGAGVFVRLSLADPRGRLRLYLGSSATPALELDAQELFAAHGHWPLLRNSTLALARMPLPFANGARLTLESDTEPAFEVLWRGYPAGSAVADWSAPQKGELDTLNAAWDAQVHGPEGQLSYTLSLSEKNPAGDFLAADPKLCAGPRAVSTIVLRAEGPDSETAIRGLVLHISFDGEETVVCPLAAFFRSQEFEPRIRATWTRDFGARWIMPYRERMDLFVENLGPPSTHVSGAVYTIPWTWDERSLHFGARWIPARGSARLALEGPGQLLGIVPGNAPNTAAALGVELDSRPRSVQAALALLERAPFEQRLVLELPEHAEVWPQRVAFFYVRPGAKIASRDPQPADRESLALDR